MRRVTIAPGEHYHIFNRGVNKQVIFHDKRDYFRFLFLLFYFQSDYSFSKIGRSVQEFVQHPVLDIIWSKFEEKRYVEVVVYSLMPNHFHLIVKETEENGIARYMQRVLNAYAKYYNTRYEKSGHVFQGPYKAVHILDNRQLLHLSAYIHRNPRELPEFSEKWQSYEWSSYLDYTAKNRWEGLLKEEIILGQFKDKKEYQNFVETSPTKLLVDEIGYKPI